jgi:phytoene synthase
MPDVFDHCEQLVREADRDRFLATLFAPQKYRRGLHALYAFSIELDRVRALARESMPGELRLQWWREAIGGAGGEAMAHPVVAASRDTAVRYDLPPASLIGVIDAHQFDLYNEPMESSAQLQAYAAQTSAAIFQSAVRILAGDVSEEVTGLANHAGQAATIAGVLARLPRHSAQRQLYVPLEVLRHHGAGAEDAFAMRSTTGLRAALAEMRLRARGHLGRIASDSSKIPAIAMPAFLPLAPVWPFLLRMERRSYDPFRPPELPQWRRQWRIWRVAKTPWRMAG